VEENRVANSEGRPPRCGGRDPVETKPAVTAMPERVVWTGEGGEGRMGAASFHGVEVYEHRRKFWHGRLGWKVGCGLETELGWEDLGGDWGIKVPL